MLFTFTLHAGGIVGLIFLILGLVWWFPVGLIILIAFVVSRAFGCWHRPQFAGGMGLGTPEGVDGKTGWLTAPAAALGIGGSNLRATIVLSMSTVLRRCVGLKTKNENSRNSWSDSAPQEIAPNWINS